MKPIPGADAQSWSFYRRYERGLAASVFSDSAALGVVGSR